MRAGGGTGQEVDAESCVASLAWSYHDELAQLEYLGELVAHADRQKRGDQRCWRFSRQKDFRF